MKPWIALACALAVSACSEPKAARPPDIVLVSIDSLRPDHLSCYGYGRPTSPNIDALAREGVRCEVATSTTCWTLPAHAALLTGLFDSTHGVVDNNLALSERLRTLAEELGDRGYQTAGFFGGPYLHPSFGFGQGFDVYESCMSPLSEAQVEAGKLGDTAAHEDITGPRTVEAVARWLAGADERPLFLFVHLWDVHYDYIPPAPYDTLFDPGYRGQLDVRNFEQNPAIAPGMAPADLAHLVALYDGEIRFTDLNLGRILDLLRAKGRFEDALVVVTADHGEEFFEHDNKGHQSSLYDEQVRVPMIWRWKQALPAGTSVRQPVRIVDVMPTLLAAAGVERPPPAQGRDLAPLLRGGTLPEEPALLELLLQPIDLRALRTSERKVIDFHGPQRVSFGFQIGRDPAEKQPAGPEAAWVLQARAELEGAVERGRRLRAELAAPPVRHAYSRELQRRMGMLGYTGGEEPPAPPK